MITYVGTEDVARAKANLGRYVASRKRPAAASEKVKEFIALPTLTHDPLSMRVIDKVWKAKEAARDERQNPNRIKRKYTKKTTTISPAAVAALTTP